MTKLERNWAERLHTVEAQLKESETKLRRDRKAAHDKMNELIRSQLALKGKLEAANKRNGSLNERVADPAQEYELRQELERHAAMIHSEQQRYLELDEEHEELLEAHEQLKRQLIRRDNMITKALERLEVSSVKKETSLVTSAQCVILG
jgi:hypothetical protein